MTDPSSVATQFTQFYYTTFDDQRENLSALYRPSSTLSFESEVTQGGEAIVEKLKSLPFSKIQHRVVTADSQLASPDGAVIVLVTGALLTDDEQNPMSYTQVFHLKPESGTYFVANDIFKLVYPAS